MDDPESRILSLEKGLQRAVEERRSCQKRMNVVIKDFEHRISIFEGAWKLLIAIVPLLAGNTIYIILGGGR